MRKKSATSKKVKGILSRAEPLEELKLVMTALFYGRSGTGKTTIMGTWPKPLLVIDIGERGTDSLIGNEGVDVIRVSEWADIEEIYWELKGGKSKYKSVSIDALHSMQSMALDEAKAISGKKSTDQTSQRDFGQAGSLMVEWCKHYRNLRDDGINVGFLAHDRVTETDTDEGDSINPEVGPRLMPAVASAITGMVNVVGNTFIREVITKSKVLGQKTQREIHYCLRIGPNGYYSTKIRSPKEISIPEFMNDPSFDKIVGVINGESSPSSKKKVRRTRNGSQK